MRASSDTKNSKRILRIIGFSILWLLTVFLAYLTWASASLALCGIYGCSANSVAPAYDPNGVRIALIVSGLLASIVPIALFILTKFKWWWLLIAVVSFIAAPTLGAYIIGAGFDGYPVGM